MAASGFTSRTNALLDRAAGVCRRRGAQLTDVRRKVLGLVLESARPIGAYKLLDQLRDGRKTAAPPTVYRALDFLLQHRLIHKVEKLSAFVGCTRRCDGEHIEAHAAQFLICKRCGRVAELDDPEVSEALARAAQRNDFALTTATVEAEGVCAGCAR